MRYNGYIQSFTCIKSWKSRSEINNRIYLVLNANLKNIFSLIPIYVDIRNTYLISVCYEVSYKTQDESLPFNELKCD